MLEVSQHVASFEERLSAAQSSPNPAEGVEALRVEFLGKKSQLKAAMKELGKLAPEDRKARAKELNEAQALIQDKLEAAKADAGKAETAARLERERVDVFLPGRITRRGMIHPVHAVEKRSLDVLRRLGFVLGDGPEVETPFYNFDALNIPEHHPARDMQDTFWVDGGNLLRSHTTTIQARTLQRGGDLPIKVASAGRVYRNEAVDATHLAMFHQLEGFWLDKGITFAHLKGVLSYVARNMYGDDAKFRFKPKFYPYTEPSIGLDIACTNCKGAMELNGKPCPACHGQGWVTIMGAGMIHPKLLREFGFDQPGVRGIAFGWGTTRMTAQWLGLDRVKSLYEHDHRFFTALNGRGAA